MISVITDTKPQGIGLGIGHLSPNLKAEKRARDPVDHHGSDRVARPAPYKTPVFLSHGVKIIVPSLSRDLHTDSFLAGTTF